MTSKTGIDIEAVHALEILDSRGRPTLDVSISLADGTTQHAQVPSGASTGSGEAVELRDGGSIRYQGYGTRAAVGNVNGPIAEALSGRWLSSLAELDEMLCEMDGTPDKAGLGANAIVGVSMAAARAFAGSRGELLWRYLTPDGVAPTLPVPHFNVVNGGAHAPNDLDFQEFMLAPLGASTLPEAVRAGAEVYAALRRRLAASGHGTGLGDEGGFAPQLVEPTDVLELLVASIREAGYPAGRDGVAIALDPAATGFYRNGSYQVAGRWWSAGDLVGYYEDLVDRYPVWSIEDGLAEDDYDGWRLLTDQLGERVQLVGDDIFVTDPTRIAEAAERGIANAALIKVNQVGTVTETLAALATCRSAGYAAMVSHRSGETPDTFVAELAVGSGCGQLKAGAPARGERVAKYNRLLELADAQPDLPIARL